MKATWYKDPITPDMTLLEVLSQYRETEAVFRRYEGEIQECLLCHALFDTLAEAAARYGLDLDRLLADLRASPQSNYAKGNTHMNHTTMPPLMEQVRASG